MQSCPTIPSLGTVMGVWAHPDDEAYLSAGLMALARRHGQRVAVVTATGGELGNPQPHRWSPVDVAALRHGELLASLDAVGVSEHHHLGMADGSLAGVPVAVGAARIGRIMHEVRPDTIVTFGPEGMTGHPDHIAVSRWTTLAWHASGRRTRLWYATLTDGFHQEWRELSDRIGVWMDGAQPPRHAPDELVTEIVCTGALLDTKQSALRAHASQTDPIAAQVGEDTFSRWWAREAFVDGAAIEPVAA